MNILIAEDDAITLRRLQHFLEKWDHHVITAVNGEDALEKFMAQDVELVITDWMMPQMDGLQLVRAIRVHFPGIPVSADCGRDTKRVKIPSAGLKERDSLAVIVTVGLTRMREFL